MNVLFTNKLDRAYALGSMLLREVLGRLIQPLFQEAQVLVMLLTHTAPLIGGLVVMIVLHMPPLWRSGARELIEHFSRRQLLARRTQPLAEA